MGYIATNPARSVHKLGFLRRNPVTDPMRAGLAAAISADYVTLASRVYDLGLDRLVQFASHSEAPHIHADQLPLHVIAARIGQRDVVVLVYDGLDDHYVATMGASFQVAHAIARYLNFNWLNLDWIADGTIGDAPGALYDLYTDDLACIAGVDIDMHAMTVHANRAYADRASRPQSLQDLIDARSRNEIPELELAVADARFRRVVAQNEIQTADAVAA